MKVLEINARVSRFNVGILVRKLLLAFLTLAIIVCGVLGGFYYQLLQNAGFVLLIGLGGAVLCLVIMFIARSLSKKDTYSRVLLTSFAASGGDMKKYRNKKEAMSAIEGMTKNSIGGKAGFKQRIAENKELLDYMLTGYQAFDEYVNKNFLAKLLVKPCLSAWNYFAVMDLCLSGKSDNAKYRVLSSTRWFPVHKNYATGLVSWLIHKLAPMLIAIILSIIANSVLSSMFDISAMLQFLIWAGIISLCLQLCKFNGEQPVLNRMASDFSEKKIGKANFQICTAFAGISDGYRQLCVMHGFIKGSPQS